MHRTYSEHGSAVCQRLASQGANGDFLQCRLLGLHTGLTSSQAVTFIAWFDVFAALAQSCLLVSGISGHMHFPAPWKATPGAVSLAFFVILLGLAINMNAAYAPPGGPGPLEQFGPAATLREYERYVARVAGWAYNLAFVSMLRTLSLTGLHTLVTIVEFKPKAGHHGEHGTPVGAVAEGEGSALTPIL